MSWILFLKCSEVSIQLEAVCLMVSNLRPQLVQSQQRTMLRPQVTTATSSMMAVRNQVPARIILGQQQVQLKELQPGEV